MIVMKEQVMIPIKCIKLRKAMDISDVAVEHIAAAEMVVVAANPFKRRLFCAERRAYPCNERRLCQRKLTS